MANYLVTGGCGFIGSHLVEALLQQGHGVRVLDDLSTGKREYVPGECELVVGDVGCRKTVQRSMQGMDGCFHLAAVCSLESCSTDWNGTHATNQVGSINVFEAAATNKTPVVYTSSAAIYGDNADVPLKESSAGRPLTAYGADKMGTELQARVASLIHGVPTTGLRLFNVYGPRQQPASPYGVIAIFLDRILNGRELPIFGDGEQTRDFIYVGDVIRFLLAAMEKVSLVPNVYNVCTGESITINQLTKIMMSVTGSNANVKRLASRKGDIRISIGDPERASRLLGVTADQNLIRGLMLLLNAKKHGVYGGFQPKLSIA